MQRKKYSSRWTSFVGSPVRGRVVRGLEEEGNPKHRVRVEHNKETLLVHVSMRMEKAGPLWRLIGLAGSGQLRRGVTNFKLRKVHMGDSILVPRLEVTPNR